MSLLHNLTGCFTEKKYFRGNGNSLTGEVKHKSMRFMKNVLRIYCFLVLKSWQIIWKIPAKDFTSVVILQAGDIKLYKTRLYYRFLEFSVTSKKVCQSLEEHLSSTRSPQGPFNNYATLFFNPTLPYVTLRNKRCNPTHMLYSTFWNCYHIFYWETVQNKKKNNVTQYDKVKCLWFMRLTWTDLRWLIFEKVYFPKIRFF